MASFGFKPLGTNLTVIPLVLVDTYFDRNDIAEPSLHINLYSSYDFRLPDGFQIICLVTTIIWTPGQPGISWAIHHTVRLSEGEGIESRHTILFFINDEPQIKPIDMHILMIPAWFRPAGVSRASRYLCAGHLPGHLLHGHTVRIVSFAYGNKYLEVDDGKISLKSFIRLQGRVYSSKLSYLKKNRSLVGWILREIWQARYHQYTRAFH